MTERLGQGAGGAKQGRTASGASTECPEPEGLCVPAGYFPFAS